LLILPSLALFVIFNKKKTCKHTKIVNLHWSGNGSGGIVFAAPFVPFLLTSKARQQKRIINNNQRLILNTMPPCMVSLDQRTLSETIIIL